MSENNGHKEAMLDRHRPVSYDRKALDLAQAWIDKEKP